MDNKERFESALYGVGLRIRAVLEKISPTVKANIQEIRLRSGLPVTLTVAGETAFVFKNGQISFCIAKDLLYAQRDDLNESFKLLCRSSVYAHAEELKNGYLIMKYGHRAGICGTFSGSLHDISSINIRIAREVFGAANEIVRRYRGGGLLIAGPPGSGKTTLLRDFIRQLASGECGRIYRVAVVDSRGELSGSFEGAATNDLGFATDILLTADKASGMEMAVRTMFPDIVAFDEIGTAEELQKVSESFCAGVRVITTAHVGCREELLRRGVTAGLIQSGAIGQIALLPPQGGGQMTLFDTKELVCGSAV